MYVGSLLPGQVREGQVKNMVSLRAGVTSLIEAKVTSAGVVEWEKQPPGSVIFDSEYDYAMSKWLVKDMGYDTYGVLKEDQSFYDSVTSKHGLGAFYSDLEHEIGISSSVMVDQGVSERQAFHAGLVKYKGHFYHLVSSSGIIVSSPYNNSIDALDYIGNTYSSFFSRVLSTDNQKKFLVGDQVEKIRHLLQSRGIASYVVAPGIVRVVK